METVLSILVLAVIGLPLVARAIWRKGDKRQAALMLVLAVVAAINIAIWTWPDATGDSPVGRELNR